MIKNYNKFISERFLPTQNDSPEMISKMNSFNKVEEDIKDFSSKKNTVYNIYMTYKDEKDLISKLKAQNLIKNAENKNKMSFTNPLLNIWAQSCQKRRRLKNIEDDIKKWEGDKSDQQSNIQTNPSMKDSLTSQIEVLDDKISTKKDEIVQLNQEIARLERQAKLKLEEMKKELNLSKKDLDIYQQTKTTKK